MPENWTKRQTVVFYFPVKLECFDEELPAGTYAVESEYAPLDSSVPGSVRTGTWIFLPAVGARDGRREMVPINPLQLEAAVKADVAKLLAR